MQERIEPPILISRLMTFVLATSVVVLVVLLLTLDKMFPLSRPQIFFLDAKDLMDKEIILTNIPYAGDIYKEQFIKDYVRVRNEITPDLAFMRTKWANTNKGVIRVRSTDSVFGEFVATEMAKLVLRDLDTSFNITCTVDFPENRAVVRQAGTQDYFIVRFTYNCYYGQDQSQKYSNNYVLKLRLKSNYENAVRWAERLDNPLGIQVSEYTETHDLGDPLNWTSVVHE